MTLRLAAAPILVAILLGAGIAGAAPPAGKRCLNAAETGQQLRQSGRLVDARKMLLTCTATECPQVIRRDCVRWVEELEAGTPTIVLKLEDESGHDVATGRVLIDGEELADAGGGRAVPIDPGTHRIAWMRPEGDMDVEIVVHEDERKRPVVLRAASKSEKIKGPDAATQPVPPPPPARKNNTPLFIGAFGGVAILGGLTFWGLGLSERGDLEDSCAKVHACSDQAVSTSKTKLVVGDILFGVGILAGVTAAWMYLRSDSSTASSSASR